MTPLEILRILVGGAALSCSLLALSVYVSDLRWANDRRLTLRLTARALLAREVIRVAQAVLLMAATLAVLARDADAALAPWQTFINTCQTLVLALMAIATLFELYTRQQINSVRPEDERVGG